MPRSVVTYVSADAMFLLASYATHPTAESPQADPSPTFYRDVLPILQKNCQSCHRPGQIAPFSLLTYESARPGARSREKTRRRRSCTRTDGRKSSSMCLDTIPTGNWATTWQSPSM